MPDDDQPSLFTWAEREADGRPRTIQERFERFLQLHPDVYEQFVEIAMQLKRRDLKRYSADGIGHVLRYHRVTSTVGAADFKVNNIFISRMARRAMEERPELLGFFELRELKSE
jgi:hypothetical protein